MKRKYDFYDKVITEPRNITNLGMLKIFVSNDFYPNLQKTSTKAQW